MIEVHAANRPGRPALLLFITAGVLAGSLGLAWTQVQVARALAPRTSIPGTPLSIAPPRGWTPAPNAPGVYDKLVHIDRGPWGQRVASEQRLWFGYRRLSVPQPPLNALRTVELIRASDAMDDPTPAKIGGLPGIEVRVASQEVIGARRVLRPRIIRAATLPRGDLIFIEYRPHLSLTLGDLTMLDDVANAVRVEDVGIGVSPQAAAQRAGVGFEPPGGWHFDLPRLAETPGFHFGPADASGAWAVHVLRTFVSGARTPSELLADAVTEITETNPFELEVDDAQAPAREEVRLWRILVPAHGEGAYGLTQAHLATSGGEAVLVLAYGDKRDSGSSRGVADRLVASLRITSGLFERQEEDRAQGSKAVESLLTETVGSTWASRVFQATYVIEALGADVRIETVRRPAPIARGRGYEGQERTLVGPLVATRWEWSVDPRGFPYFASVQRAGESDDPQLWIRESCLANGPIRRERSGEFSKRWEFDLPEAFLPPPLLDLLAAQVARAGGQIQVSTSKLLGRGAGNLVIRSLPAENGAPRAVVVQDHSPLAEVRTFGSDGELNSLRSELYSFSRVR